MKKRWIWKNEKERQAYTRILGLTLPIVIQNLFSAAVSSADVIMLNSVGQSAISAVSLATQFSYVLHMIFYGLGSGVSMLCAQYWGKGDLKAIEKVEGIAMRFTLLMGVVFAVPSMCVPQLMMKIFTNDQELVTIGASYLRIVSVSFLCWGFSEIFLSVLRSVERVKASTSLNVLALVLNIFLNAVFIYGWFGAPKMGAEGVALATSISRAIQLAACFMVSARSKDVKFRLSAMFWKSGVLMKDFIRISLPALGNDLVWSTGFSMYSVIMGHMGSDVVAANSIVSVVRTFGTVLCYAVGNASAIYVGKDIGANRMEDAREDGARAVRLAVVTGIIGGLIVLAIMPFALRFASLTETANGYLRTMLLINSYYIMGISLNSILIAGVFRAGGDSRFGLICDIFDMWCYAVPLGFFAAFVLDLPPMVVYFFLCTDEFAKWPWVIRRYTSGKWMKNITRENV